LIARHPTTATTRKIYIKKGNSLRDSANRNTLPRGRIKWDTRRGRREANRQRREKDHPQTLTKEGPPAKYGQRSRWRFCARTKKEGSTRRYSGIDAASSVCDDDERTHQRWTITC
jgi:hypothetical protein